MKLISMRLLSVPTTALAAMAFRYSRSQVRCGEQFFQKILLFSFQAQEKLQLSEGETLPPGCVV